MCLWHLGYITYEKYVECISFAIVAATTIRKNILMNFVPLRITRGDGSTNSLTASLERLLPQTFTGRVLFQIEDDAKVRAFVLPGLDAGRAGEMPWAVPPNWQGTTSIPGISTGE